MEFPTALLGVALGVVLLPQLSAAAGARTTRKPIPTLLDWGLRLVVLLALPCAVALIVFPQPMIAVLYHYGAFTRRRRAADGRGADGLRRRPDGPGRRQGAGAGLLREAGHPHAGAHRGRRAGPHAGDEPRVRAAVSAMPGSRCRSGSARCSMRVGCWRACSGAASIVRPPAGGASGCALRWRPRRSAAASPGRPAQSTGSRCSRAAGWRVGAAGGARWRRLRSCISCCSRCSACDRGIS